jgi:transposase-like protein
MSVKQIPPHVLAEICRDLDRRGRRTPRSWRSERTMTKHVDTIGAVGVASRLFGASKLEITTDFETWRRRDLSELPIVYLFLDEQYPAARQGTDEEEGVLSDYALMEDGRPVLLHLDLGSCESYDARLSSLQDLVDLVARGLREPLLA